jgi:hypothetical protein
LRGVEIELEQIAGLPVGAVRGQAVVAGGQFDVGPGDARPGDGELPLAAYRLAGDAAVVQREAGIDHRLRCQVAAGLEAGIDVRRRQAAEAARVEVLQFAFRREFAPPVEIEFAVRQQAGSAGSQLQFGQAQAPPARLASASRLKVASRRSMRTSCRSPAGWRKGAGQAGGVQAGQQLPGIEAAGLQVELEAVVAPAAVAGQFAAAGQGGVQGVQRGLRALPAQRAGQGGERQALAVERAGLVVGQAEAADDAVRLRRDVGDQAELGLRGAGPPAGRVDALELQAGAGERAAAKGVSTASAWPAMPWVATMPRSMRSSRPWPSPTRRAAAVRAGRAGRARRRAERRQAVEAGLPGERDVACLQLQVVEAVLAAIAGQAAAQLLEQWLAVVVRLPEAEAFDRHGQRQLQVGWQGAGASLGGWSMRRVAMSRAADLQPAMQQVGG